MKALLLPVYLAVVVLPMRAGGYEAGDEVIATREAPAFFYEKVNRMIKAGERIIVVKHDKAASRVFFLKTDSDGKQIALNIAASAVGYTEEQRIAREQAKVEERNQQAAAEVDAKKVQAQCAITQATREGSIVEASVAARVPRTVQKRGNFDPLGNMGRGKQNYFEQTVVETEFQPIEGHVFIHGLKTVPEGQSWSGTLYPAGVYEYTDDQRAFRRIARYALTAGKALELMQKEPQRDDQ